MIKELNYELTKKDVLKFHYYSCFSSKKFYLVILFFVILGLFLNFLIKEENIGIIIIFMGLFFLIIAPVLINLNYKNTKVKIIVNSDNQIINTENAIAKVEYNWNNIEKISKTKKYLLIYVNKDNVILIPKRIFESEQEMNETWELIQECYNKNREE